MLVLGSLIKLGMLGMNVGDCIVISSHLSPPLIPGVAWTVLSYP